MSRRKTLEEKMNNYEIVTETGCWIWMGCVNREGYGQVSVDGRLQRAHRVFFGLDKIPKGMLVCHKCDVPSCVNPDHLFLGTQTDNILDMMSKGRGRNHNQGKKCCGRCGGDYYVGKGGSRKCKPCANRYAQASAIRNYLPKATV